MTYYSTIAHEAKDWRRSSKHRRQSFVRVPLSTLSKKINSAHKDCYKPRKRDPTDPSGHALWESELQGVGPVVPRFGFLDEDPNIIASCLAIGILDMQSIERGRVESHSDRADLCFVI